MSVFKDMSLQEFYKLTHGRFHIDMSNQALNLILLHYQAEEESENCSFKSFEDIEWQYWHEFPSTHVFQMRFFKESTEGFDQILARAKKVCKGRVYQTGYNTVIAWLGDA